MAQPVGSKETSGLPHRFGPKRIMRKNLIDPVSIDNTEALICEKGGQCNPLGQLPVLRSSSKSSCLFHITMVRIPSDKYNLFLNLSLDMLCLLLCKTKVKA